MKTYIVSGGCGFIGSEFVRQVLAVGNIKVVNVDKLTYAADERSIPDSIRFPNYVLEKTDICDRLAVNDILLKYEPDAVIHFAAESHVDRSIDGPKEFLDTNVMGTFAMLEAARDYFHSSSCKSPDFLFLHISTDEVFGSLGMGRYFDEGSPYMPNSPYAASKAASDHLVRAWGKTFDLPHVVTNCSNNYGWYQFPEKLIPHCIINALMGKAIPIYGDGQQIRDWIHVEDHVCALIKVLAEGHSGETYLIGSRQERSNLSVVNSICEILQELKAPLPAGRESFSSLIEFVDDRPGHDKRYAIQPNKIERELLWAPKYSFEDGLRLTVEWYLANKDWWQAILNGDYSLGRLGASRKSK